MAKVQYGYCEWYFANIELRDQFLENVPNIHWGELYQKPRL